MAKSDTKLKNAQGITKNLCEEIQDYFEDGGLWAKNPLVGCKRQIIYFIRLSWYPLFRSGNEIKNMLL